MGGLGGRGAQSEYVEPSSGRSRVSPSTARAARGGTAAVVFVMSCQRCGAADVGPGGDARPTHGEEAEDVQPEEVEERAGGLGGKAHLGWVLGLGLWGCAQGWG